jgi:outer membrane usher protein FimD/PapC
VTKEEERERLERPKVEQRSESPLASPTYTTSASISVASPQHQESAYQSVFANSLSREHSINYNNNENNHENSNTDMERYSLSQDMTISSPILQGA